MTKEDEKLLAELDKYFWPASDRTISEFKKWAETKHLEPQPQYVSFFADEWKKNGN